MLKPLEREAIPAGREPYSSLRLFAADVVKEFIESKAEAAEITDWPEGSEISKLTSQLRTELWRVKLKDSIKVMKRGDRLFLMWKQRWDSEKQELVSHHNKAWDAKEKKWK